MYTIEELADCVECKEGLTLNPSNGKVEACEICNGIGVTTPGSICYCGSSCADILEDIPFCGNMVCYKALVEANRVEAMINKYRQSPTSRLVERFHHQELTPDEEELRRFGIGSDFWPN